MTAKSEPDRVEFYGIVEYFRDLVVEPSTELDEFVRDCTAKTLEDLLSLIDCRHIDVAQLFGDPEFAQKIAAIGKCATYFNCSAVPDDNSMQYFRILLKYNYAIFHTNSDMNIRTYIEKIVGGEKTISNGVLVKETPVADFSQVLGLIH